MRNWSAMGVIDDVHLVCEPVHRVHILSIYFRAEIVQRGDVTLLCIARRDGTKRMCIAQAAWTRLAIQCARIAHGHGYLGIVTCAWETILKAQFSNKFSKFCSVL